MLADQRIKRLSVILKVADAQGMGEGGACARITELVGSLIILGFAVVEQIVWRLTPADFLVRSAALSRYVGGRHPRCLNL